MSSITNDNNLVFKQLIFEKIKAEINEIIDGYTIIDYEDDGYDDYGSLRWVTCKNDLVTRDYDIKKYITIDIINYLQHIIKGIKINYQKTEYTFQISDKIIFKQNISLDDIIILSEQEINKRDELRDELTLMKDNFIASLEHLSNTNSTYDIRRIDVSKLKNYISTFSYESFCESIFILFNFTDFAYNNIINTKSNGKLIINILKNSRLPEQHLHAIREILSKYN